MGDSRLRGMMRGDFLKAGGLVVRALARRAEPEPATLPTDSTGYGISPPPPRSPSGLHNSPWPQALTKAAGMGVVATSAEGMRSQAGTSAEGVPSRWALRSALRSAIR